MNLSVSVLGLVSVFTLALFLVLLNIYLWRVQRLDRTPLWLAGWLFGGAMFAMFRVFQYFQFNEAAYILFPRILLTFAFSMAWIGYGLANSFIGYHPPKWERLWIILLVSVPVILLWTSNLILTSRIIIRSIQLGGDFHGVQSGLLYLPASILILGLGVIPSMRLLRSPGGDRGENILMGVGFLFVILFSLNDFIATAFNFPWIRLSDYSHMFPAILFSFIQVQRFGRLYRNMDGVVQKRTEELKQANEDLCVKFIEHSQAEKEMRRQAQNMMALYETTRNLVVEHDLNNLLQTIVEQSTRLLNAEGGGMYLSEPDHEHVRCVVSYQTPKDFTGTLLRYGEGAAGLVAQSAEALIIDDYANWSGRASVFKQMKPFRAVMSVPIKWQEELLGVLHVLEFSKERHFTQSDLQLAMSFANQAAIAIHNAHLYTQLQQELAEREEVEAALQASEERYRLLFDSNPHSMWVYDLESLNFLMVNDAALERYGFSREEFLQMGIKDIRPSEDFPALMENMAQERQKVEWSGPWKHRKKDGTIISVEILSHELHFNGSSARLVLASDITERVRAENEMLRKANEMSALAEVAQDISSTLDLDVVLDRVAVNAKNLLDAETSAVYLTESDESSLRAIAAYGPDAEEIKQDPLEIGAGILGGIANCESGEIVNESQLDPRAITIKGTVDVPHEHIMGVPVFSKNRLTGLIAVWRNGIGNEFSSEDLDFLTKLAGQVAIAIENARLYESTRQRLSEIEAVHTVSSALRSARTLDEALPIILDQLMDLLHVGGASLAIVDPGSGEIVTELAHGAWAPVTGLRTPGGMGISGHVITTGTPYVSSEVVRDSKAVRPDLFGGLNAVACVPVITHNRPIGALWIGRQTPIREDEVSLLSAISEMVGNAIHRMMLFEKTEGLVNDLQISNLELSIAYDTTLEGWAKALELRDKETEGHSRRLVDLTLQLAKRLRMPDMEITNIRRGILLHDIGKMGVPDHILRKKGSLDEEEWVEMRKHPQYAYDLLHPITYLRPTVDIPYCHHEKWDGSGYPRGLQGTQIPLAARIFAVVDVYDALSSDRPYRKAWPREKVLDYLRAEAGKHFDPRVVKEFLHLIGENGKREIKNYSDDIVAGIARI